MKIDIQKHETPKTQNQEVLYHLKYVGTLTSMSAIRDYGITRLASRVHTLRDNGWDIRSESKGFTTRHGKDSHYNEYYLVRFDS